VTVIWLASASAIAARPSSVNYSNWISRADLNYARAVDRSDDGVPIGNGRMRMMIWTETLGGSLLFF